MISPQGQAKLKLNSSQGPRLSVPSFLLTGYLILNLTDILSLQILKSQPSCSCACLHLSTYWVPTLAFTAAAGRAELSSNVSPAVP